MSLLLLFSGALPFWTAQTPDTATWSTQAPDASIWTPAIAASVTWTVEAPEDD